MNRRTHTVAAAGAALALVMSLGTAGHAAGNGKAYGTVKPFRLNMQALQDKAGNTDLYLNVTSEIPGFAVPEVLNKVQLKSYKMNGKLAYTKNLFEVAAPGGQALITLSDVQRYQPLQVSALAKTVQTVNMEHLPSGEVKTLFRPDLAVTGVLAPSAVYTGTTFPIQVYTKELNGDLGATARVTILNGDTVLDTIPAVTLGRNGDQALSLTFALTNPGTYTLRALISDVQPGDYDHGNNEATFTVTVQAPPPPPPGDGEGEEPPRDPVKRTVRYQSNYSFSNSQTNMDSLMPGATVPNTYRQTSDTEQFWLVSFTEDRVTTAGTFTMRVQTETGTLKEVTYTFSGPGQFSGPDGTFWIETTEEGTHFGTRSDANMWAYTMNWDGYADSKSGGVGRLTGATTSVQVFFDLTVANLHYGGNYSLALTPNQTSYDNTTDGFDGSRTRSWGSTTLFEGTGFGTTAW